MWRGHQRPPLKYLDKAESFEQKENTAQDTCYGADQSLDAPIPAGLKPVSPLGL